MKECVHIGVIGCGWIAEHAHIPNLMKNEHVRIVAAYDENMERAKMICNKFCIPNVFAKIDEFFKCDFDGVIILTPNHTHYSYTIQALKRGVGVLCEKPLVLKEAEMNHILKIVKEKNTVYIPGYVNRWRKDMQWIHHEIQNGAIGKVSKVNAGWLRKSGVPRPGTWFTSQRHAGGGVLIDLGSHMIDLCLLLLGDGKPGSCRLLTSMCDADKLKESDAAAWFKRKEDILFQIDVEDSAIADVVFEDNKSLSIKLSWNAPIAADCTYFKIEGSLGRIELKTLFGFSDERLWPEDSIIIENGQGKKEIKPDKELNHTRNAFDDMLSDYVQALRGKKSDSDMLRDAAYTISLTEKLYLSNRIDERQMNARLLEDL